MAKTSQPTRAPNKMLYLTDYARSAWDIGALSATLRRWTEHHAEMATPCWSFPAWGPATCPR